MFEPSRTFLLLCLQRALLGNVGKSLRQASIEADVPSKLVRVRFEYDSSDHESSQELASAAAAEVVSDLPFDWNVEEQHRPVSNAEVLLSLAYIAYRRAAR